MKKLQTISLLLSIIFFISCKKEITEKKTTVKKSEIVENNKRIFDDYIKSIKPERVNLNTDSIPEYIFCEMGNYTFFDGKTKNEIDYIANVSKYGGSEDLKIIDVNCNDNQKEFIVESTGGGTLGNYHYMDIMKYNSETQKINSIFNYEISSFHWNEDKEVLDYVHYIDVLYKKNDNCIDKIKVFQGEFIDKPKSYSLNIKPKKLIEIYYFNKKTGSFDKKVE
ncbi:hypothetical protein [Flavobacterium sp.]|uniref:hypothetical protein n=1 Tax=Flavobacterium sp. TaxID=239 RepID=UPI002602B03F|nr:hypothetical protein [Flavobacterium sp.]